MLLSFSVENFRSFKEEQTLGLIASKRLGDTSNPTHCIPIPDTDEASLRVAAIYGANGAGKTNLVRALRMVEQMVLHGTPPGKRISHEPFLLDNEEQEKPTCFELQFLQDGRVFRYGFCFDTESIYEEWLSFYEGKKERSIFTRIPSKKGAANVELGPNSGGYAYPARLMALAKVGARPNQLFLTEIVNLDDEEDQGALCQEAITWFSSTLSIIEVGSRFEMLAETLATDNVFADFAGTFLREANTGIAGLSVQTKEIPRAKASTVPSDIWTQLDQNLEEDHVAVLPGPDGADLFIDGSQKDVVKLRQITARHDALGCDVQFPLHEESDGSRQLLNLLPALYKQQKAGGVFVIDELERSMHPILARKFVEFFLKTAKGSNSQLIFSTHESTLLDLDILRRDGIWFTEKDESGATQLYSLADFKVRNDLRVDKGYLQGRFGAIPFLGGIDHLIEEASA